MNPTHPDSNHLGNTRVTFTNTPGANTLYATDIKQINHYYPFGLNMEGPGFGAQGANKYQYNSKELNSDFGLNWNDYGARFYDPAIARWNVVDPMSDLASSLTPYRYGFNNPISFSDPDGMFESEDEAKQYAKDNGIKTGWFRSSKIVEQKDGSYAIENRKASTSISNDNEFGVTTAALHIERGVHLADVGFSGALALAESNPDGVFKNDGFDRLYYFGSYLQFAMPTAKLATASKAVNTGVTVLGHYPEYVNLAEKLGARVFQIPVNVWNKMSPAEQWAANAKFLDRMILRGDNIRLATPINQIKPGSFFEKELNYLFENGYKVSSDGLWLNKYL